MVKKYDTNHLAAIRAINRHVGEVMWYEFYRDEYAAQGGRRENCSGATERVVSHFPDCVEWITVARYGQVVVCKIHVIKEIRLD